MENDLRDQRDSPPQLATFERLRIQVRDFLKQYGRPDSLSAWGDFSAHADFRHSRQVKVSIGKLELLEPAIIAGLQKILKTFPGWEIVVAVAVDGHYYDWPDMGLYIRSNEIVDELRREYLPIQFQGFSYPGARPG